MDGPTGKNRSGLVIFGRLSFTLAVLGFVGLLGLFSCTPTQDENTGHQVERELSLYDYGGSHPCTSSRGSQTPPEVADSARKAIREFLWSHWQGCRPGYIDTLCSSVDYSVDRRYIVEPEGGHNVECTIVVEEQNSHAPGGPWLPIIHTYYQVDRIETDDGFQLRLHAYPHEI